MKRVLVLASVASMIDQFNMPNIELLQELGYEVHVACNFEKGNTCSVEKIRALKRILEKKRVSYFQIDFSRSIWNLKENIKSYRQVKKLLKINQYIFLHCHAPIGGVIGRVAGYTSGVKVVYTAHGFHFYKGAAIKNWMLYYPIEKWLSYYTYVLITITREDYERAKKSFHAKYIEYIPGAGVNLEKIDAIQVNKMEKRKSLDIPDKACLLISVGELNQNKNHEMVIQAISAIEDTNLYYIICGLGDREEYLKQLIKNLGIGQRVRLPGFRDDIIEIMKSADIAVHPSKREGLSMAVMEAMACGLPCIVSDIRGNRELVENNKSGYCFPLGRAEELEKSIRSLSQDPQKRRDLGAEGKKKIKRNSSMLIAKQMLEIYKNTEAGQTK